MQFETIMWYYLYIYILNQIFCLQFFHKFVTGGIPFVIANNNRNMNELYFIHIPKNMGTLIHYNLPKKYNKKYYGSGLLNNKYYFTCRDHILINDMIKIEPKIKKIPIIAIIREPIQRFMSICNYLHIDPDSAIQKCKLFRNESYPTFKNSFNFFIPQVNFIKSDYKLDLSLFTLENKKGIINWFDSVNVKIDLSKKLNSSRKIYKKENLTDLQMQFLKFFYKNDINLYQKLKNSKR